MSGKDTIFVKQTSNIMKTLNLILTGLMAQNIMLSAWSLGVGLGYADESPEAKPRNASKVKYVE